MTDQSKPRKQKKNGIKHLLFVYRYIANRYRSPAILLALMGFILLLPTWISQLRFKTIFTTQGLSYIGLASIIAGVGLLILAIFMEKRAYTQCKPDFLLIHTLSKTIRLPYHEIVTVQSVSVGRVFAIREIKGRDQHFIKPLQNEMAVEVEVSPEFWADEQKLKRDISPLIFSPRTPGFVLICENPSQLGIEINRFTQESLDRRTTNPTGYLDPIERAAVQQGKR